MAVLAFLVAAPMWAQSTVATGSIQGTVTDPNDAVVANASITITNAATGEVKKVSSTSSGTFASGALIPGDYQVRVEAPGFQTVVTKVAVQVGVITSGNTRLAVGKTSEIVEVAGSAVQVNTDQATVQGVLTAQQIDNLPINGRNFLDLAQLEPGVQIQDGGNFDPTKNGYSSISFGGRFGRTARIEVDGVDISDETVGTTTQNIPAGAIEQFQISQSSLDLSTELTSSGAVNVVTRSGSNKWHGEAFYLFRDHTLAATLGDHDIPFQRNQFGGRLGGPILKNKLFFFVDAERIKQDLFNQVATGSPFTSLAGGFNSPFHDTDGIAKLDWQINNNYHAFYRFSYEQNRAVKAFVSNAFQPFANVDNTPAHVAGLDFTTGSFTHQIRFGYTKFRNGITDAVAGSNILDPAPGIELAIGGDPFCIGIAFDPFCSGPNFLAPQQTYQANHQIKYDGSKTIGAHILRYGFGYNHIQGGGFAKFLGLAPAVSSPASGVTISNAFPGGASNPLNYPATNVTLGNGIGFSSEKPAFGLPAGGLGPDDRVTWYAGDSWKIKPNLTLTYGLRYVRDTGRTDSDLGTIPCSALFANGQPPSTLSPADVAALQAQCASAGSVLDMFGPGLGKPVKQPNGNFAPQFGFAWDPASHGKTVIRGGIGLYYENSIFNNNLFDRPGRLQQGLFLNFATACSNGAASPVALPGGGTVTPTFCGQPIGTAAPAVIALQKQFQAATIAAGPSSNNAFIGNALSGFTSVVLFDPNYKTPRSVQMNIGMEHQLWKGVVLSADYVRNVQTHSLLAIDVNHVGDARFFNKNAAQAAVAATLANCGAATVNQAIVNCPTNPTGQPGPYTPRPATMADFIFNGLGSGAETCGGAPCPTAAFGGKNSRLGVLQMLEPSGRSVYNGLQTSLKANVSNPIKGIKNFSWQVSYSLSSYIGTAKDGDFINTAIDNNDPAHFIGPNALDRKHQLSFGGYVDLPWSFRFGAVSHFYSPLPVSLFLPTTGAGIFATDVTGDGSGDGTGVYPVGDLLPGTNVGAFGRSIPAGNLNQVINNYNNTQANTPTPAGQVLIQNGILTLAQLQALGGVQQSIALAPNGQVGLDWLKALDLKLSWPKKVTESFTIEPSVAVFNAMNFANFDAPGGALTGILGGGPGSVNGTTMADRNNGLAATRIGVGSGVFSLGAPRVIEFGLRLTF
jgi:hypothetical protein